MIPVKMPFRIETKEEREFNREKLEFIQRFRWEMVMQDLVNKMDKTYYLDIISKTNYGFFARMYLVPGLSFSDFNSKIDVIQENLQVIWIMTYKKFSKFAEIKIVNKALDDKMIFEAPEDWKPYEVYLGLSFSLKINRVNVNTYCHYLCGGATRSGKTRLIYMILLCWIIRCKLNEVEIYLGDVCKDEYCSFEHVRMVRYYANSTEKLWKMMKYLKLKFEKRMNIISKYREDGRATTIEEYNKIVKVPMSYCYVFIDEFALVVPKRSDKLDIKAMKEEIMDIIGDLERAGAGMGIIMFVSLQKTSKDELGDSIIKNQSCVRIGFRMNDRASSDVLLEDDSARGLEPRYARYSLSGGADKDYLFSPYLTTEHMRKLLSPHIDPKYRKADVEEAVKENREENAARNVKVTEKKKPKKKEPINHAHDVTEIPDY